jgi:hypothetical protein
MKVVHPSANLHKEAPSLPLFKSSTPGFCMLYGLLQVTTRRIIKHQYHLSLIEEAIMERNNVRMLHLLQQPHFLETFLTPHFIPRIELNEFLHDDNEAVHLALCLVHIRELPLPQNLSRYSVVVHVAF